MIISFQLAVQYVLIPAAVRNITFLAAGSVIISFQMAVISHPCGCQEHNGLAVPSYPYSWLGRTQCTCMDLLTGPEPNHCSEWTELHYSASQRYPLTAVSGSKTLYYSIAAADCVIKPFYVAGSTNYAHYLPFLQVMKYCVA